MNRSAGSLVRSRVVLFQLGGLKGRAAVGPGDAVAHGLTFCIDQHQPVTNETQYAARVADEEGAVHYAAGTFRARVRQSRHVADIPSHSSHQADDGEERQQCKF